ncbi:hypothetical protein [Streptomyces sp. NPDC053367]|uniref:hypothetical protein n=1 Tax=Streptomyces sp. NPDC053367 TaxID=3365700 RepID=UPI0037CD57F3
MFVEEFTHMLQAGHEEVQSLDGSPPPLTRMGLGMEEIFAGAECRVYRSGVADRWMVVSHSGPWVQLGLADLAHLARGGTPLSPANVFPYRLPHDLEGIASYDLQGLLTALGVADRYGSPETLAQIEYEFVDYYPPKRLLEYVVRVPLAVPPEARAFLAEYAERYTPVSFEDEE